MMITQFIQELPHDDYSVSFSVDAGLTLNVAHHHAYVFHILQHEKADTLGRKKFPRNHHIVELGA
jgi:hypothetical protein